MKIAVFGGGYVGLSNAVLLSTRAEVAVVDIDADKVRLINEGKSPVRDDTLQKYLSEKPLRLYATADAETALCGAEAVVVATPTDYDEGTGRFDTSSVEQVIRLARRRGVPIVVKSTVPPGFCDRMAAECDRMAAECNGRAAEGNGRAAEADGRAAEGHGASLFFMPEFLREGKALYDNLYPARIVIGCGKGEEQAAGALAKLWKDCAENDPPILVMRRKEAESVKLFANSYLAVRVAFFNELDTFAQKHSLSAGRIIAGVCADERVGSFYNNPSFGYGGYCLPKDTKQLLADFANVPGDLIRAVVRSNDTRKDFIADTLCKMAGENGTIGIYKLHMKVGSDNHRESAVLGVIDRLKKRGRSVLIYEPSVEGEWFRCVPVVNHFAAFAKECAVIAANRYEAELAPVRDKLFTRDLFGMN